MMGTMVNGNVKIYGGGRVGNGRVEENELEEQIAFGVGKPKHIWGKLLSLSQVCLPLPLFSIIMLYPSLSLCGCIANLRFDMQSK